MHLWSRNEMHSVMLWKAMIVMIASGVCAVSATANDGEPYDLGGGKFLFLDTFMLDEVENAQLTVNPPRFDELALIADQPWEKGGITSYGNVFFDPITKEYRLYYVPVSWDVDPGFCVALAISKDGRNWEKPSLSVVEWKGSKENNIVIWGQREGTVIIDPNAPGNRRYAYLSSEQKLKTQLFTSPDGIHFAMDEKPISSIHSDSQISAFWNPETNKYYFYPRVADNGRAAGVVVVDAMNQPWPEEIPVAISSDKHDPECMDLYTNACQKYEGAPHSYIGFPTPYYHYNEPEKRAYLNAPTLAIGGKTNDGALESQLATSRDGVNWIRYRTPYIPMGKYDGLDVKVAMMIPGIFYENDLLVQFFMGYAFTHGDTQVRHGEGGRSLGGVFRVEQRIDGFISLDFDYEGGTVTTEPFVFEGAKLMLNINTSASGEAQVAILDAGKKEFPGFGLDTARIINGDYIKRTVEWGNGASDVATLAGKPVRLRFKCRGTKLYAFEFAK